MPASSILNRWQPSPEQPWDLRRVWHLHRRAGFAGTWGEMQRDLNDGVSISVNRFLEGTSRLVGVPDDFVEMADTIGHAAMTSGNIQRLKAWWIYRILFSPDPLTERLTLMWHNHFATSYAKVDDVRMMWRQNLLLREHARGPFRNLLTTVVKDPAMLVWLDAAANRKEHPNENLARELMELFTLGEGHYTERDVTEAARCLTGWTVSKGTFRNRVRHHDEGQKTVLGTTGALSGDDLLNILLSRPETSARLAWRLCDMFLGENVATAKDILVLADGLREHDLNIRWAVETLLRSELFFSSANMATRVASPVDFTVGAVRALELINPPPSTLRLAEYIDQLGQQLFLPPNVFGWGGGRKWINTSSMIGRGRFAAELIDGDLHNFVVPTEAFELAERHIGKTSLVESMAFYSQLLLGDAASLDVRFAPDIDCPTLIQRILASPEAQLC